MVGHYIGATCCVVAVCVDVLYCVVCVGGGNIRDVSVMGVAVHDSDIPDGRDMCNNCRFVVCGGIAGEFS